LALASFAVPAAVAAPPPVPAAPQVRNPLVAVPSPRATPTAAPTASPEPFPTVLTIDFLGFSESSRFSAPLLDFKLANPNATPSPSLLNAGKINFNTFSIQVPLGANATKLEQYYQNKTPFQEVDVLIPPNTRNVFKLVNITSFSENVTNTQSTVRFALAYGGMEIKTVPTPDPILERVKAPALIPSHAP